MGVTNDQQGRIMEDKGMEIEAKKGCGQILKDFREIRQSMVSRVTQAVVNASAPNLIRGAGQETVVDYVTKVLAGAKAVLDSQSA